MFGNVFRKSITKKNIFYYLFKKKRISKNFPETQIIINFEHVW